MRYFETERESRRNTDLRVVGLGIAVVVLSAMVAILWIRDDDDPTTAPSTTPAAETTTTADASTTTGASAPPSQLTPTIPGSTAGIDAVTLVEDCVQYVPTAVYFGNFYMKAIWDLGGGTPEGLRRVCEGMVIDDPAGLQRMSDEYHDLKAFVETTTTV